VTINDLVTRVGNIEIWPPTVEGQAHLIATWILIAFVCVLFAAFVGVCNRIQEAQARKRHAKIMRPKPSN
jgi:Zn-dependent protease with chaperone function